MTLKKLVGYMTLDELVKTSYSIAKSKGWWDKPRSFAALTLLMQSEISEALEDYRANKGLNEIWYENNKVKAPRCDCGADHGQGCEIHCYLMPDGHCSCYVIHKKPCGIPSELADVIIRIADFCGHFNFVVLDPQSSSGESERRLRDSLSRGQCLPLGDVSEPEQDSESGGSVASRELWGERVVDLISGCPTSSLHVRGHRHQHLACHRGEDGLQSDEAEKTRRKGHLRG